VYVPVIASPVTAASMLPVKSLVSPRARSPRSAPSCALPFSWPRNAAPSSISVDSSSHMRFWPVRSRWQNHATTARPSRNPRNTGTSVFCHFSPSAAPSIVSHAMWYVPRSVAICGGPAGGDSGGFCAPTEAQQTAAQITIIRRNDKGIMAVTVFPRTSSVPLCATVPARGRCRLDAPMPAAR